MPLPTDWNGIPVRQSPRTAWTVHVQGGFSPGEIRFSTQGHNFRPIGNLAGMKPNTIAKVVGYAYYDTRPGSEGVVQTFDVENWDLAEPVEYLTDPKTNLPSGITRAGALAEAHNDIVTAHNNGELPNNVGRKQQETQEALDREAAERGLPVGPGPGVVTQDFKDELRDFLDRERQRLADEIERVANGGLPSGFVPQAPTITASGGVGSFGDSSAMQTLLFVGAALAVAKALDLI